MAVETPAAVVEAMLLDFSLCSSTLGGLEFYGTSIEFRDLIQVCRDFAGRHDPGQGSDLTFIERFHGKSTMAKAVDTEAKSGGLSVFCFDGTIGATEKGLRDLQSRTDVLTIVDGLPEPAINRRTTEEIQFRGWKGADSSLRLNIAQTRVSIQTCRD
jgi:hypothetical protein